MMEQFSRTEALLGKGAMERLTNARVAGFGIGGVGGYCVEALARSGVGTLALFDHDTVSLTNLNRQILATHSVIGQPKVEVAKARIAAINPDARVLCYPVFYTPETAEQFDFTQFDYIVDAIDTVTGKLCLIQQAMAAGTPVISCMGHLQNHRLPPGADYAQGAAKSGHSSPEGGLLHRGSPQAPRHGRGSRRLRKKTNPRKHRSGSGGGWIDFGRRGYPGSDEMTVS